MLYQIAHILRDKLTWLWNIIDWVNGLVFSLRYGRILKDLVLKEVPEDYRIVTIKDVGTEHMVEFFNHQPKEAFTFYKPHDLIQRVSNDYKKTGHFLGMC